MKNFFINCTINILAAFYIGTCLAGNAVDDCIYLDDLSAPLMKDWPQYTLQHDKDYLLMSSPNVRVDSDDEDVYELQFDDKTDSSTAGGGADLSLHLSAFAKGEECAIIQDCLSAFANGESPEAIYNYLSGFVETEKCVGIYNFLSTFANGEERTSVCKYLAASVGEEECDIIYDHLSFLVKEKSCVNICNVCGDYPIADAGSVRLRCQAPDNADTSVGSGSKKSLNKANASDLQIPGTTARANDGVKIDNAFSNTKPTDRGDQARKSLVTDKEESGDDDPDYYPDPSLDPDSDCGLLEPIVPKKRCRYSLRKKRSKKSKSRYSYDYAFGR